MIRSYFAKPLSTVLYVSEGEGEGSTTDKKVPTAAEIQAAVDAATAGLKAKNDELLGKLAKNAETLKRYEGFDPEKLKDLQQRLDQDEDTKLFSEGKKDVVINKYTERMRSDHEAKLAAAAQALEAQKAATQSYRNRVLDNEIRAVATDLHKGAIEDALLVARQVFTLDETGNAVQLDKDGRPIMGKDGKTPFSPKEWIESMKETKPHWFPAMSSGSGSGSATPDGKGGKTISRAAFAKLGPVEQATAIKTYTLVD